MIITTLFIAKKKKATQMFTNGLGKFFCYINHGKGSFCRLLARGRCLQDEMRWKAVYKIVHGL